MPGDNSFDVSLLEGMVSAKFGQTKGLSLNLGKQKGYGLNAKPPAVGRGLFLISILSIADGGELTCQLYFIWFEGVRWFWGLTCDFWAENFEKKCKSNKQKQILFGDANQKCNGKSKGRDWGLVGGLHPTLRDGTAKDGAPGRWGLIGQESNGNDTRVRWRDRGRRVGRRGARGCPFRRSRAFR